MSMISKIKRNLLKKQHQILSTLFVALLAMAMSPVNVFAIPLLNKNMPPSGATATTNTSNTQVTINQTANNAVLNWSNFNIGKGEIVTFNQPSAKAIAFNLIKDTNASASQILGTLNANGHVFLQNPNGIVFGAGCQVSVGGLIATTLNTINPTATTYSLSKDSTSNGKIVNNGTITATNGQVVLIAPQVENYGTITASNGVVIDTGANTPTTYDVFGDKAVTLKVSATGDVINTSGINTAATVIDQDGLVILEGAISTSIPSSSTTVSGKNILVGKATLSTPNLSLQATDNMIVTSQADLKMNDLNASAGGNILWSAIVDKNSPVNVNIVGNGVYLQGASDKSFFPNGSTGSVHANVYGLYNPNSTDMDPFYNFSGTRNFGSRSNLFSSIGFIQGNPDIAGTQFYSCLDPMSAQLGGMAFIFDQNNNGGIKQVIIGAKSNTQLGSDGATSIGSNGILLKSSHYDSDRGAITLVDSQKGRGIVSVSADNSFIGTNAGDKLGGNNDYVTQTLSNGNLAMTNWQWNDFKGIATFINTNDITQNKFGVLSKDNSLVGSNTYDRVGYGGAIGVGTLDSKSQRYNNYVVVSPYYQQNLGAVSWGSGSGDNVLTGLITKDNSLIGSTLGDQIGSNGVYVLKSGDYLVLSPLYANITAGLFKQAGAITYGYGDSGVQSGLNKGSVDYTVNSLIGSYANDSVGKDQTVGLQDYARAYQDIVGIQSNMDINKGIKNNTTLKGGIQEFSNGDFAIIDTNWNSGKGAIFFANGSRNSPIPLQGQMDGSNSFTGFFKKNDTVQNYFSQALGDFTDSGQIDIGDQMGSGGIVELNGKYIIFSPSYFNNRGMVTITDANSVGPYQTADFFHWKSNWATASNAFSYIGMMPNSSIGSGGVVDLGNNKLALLSPSYTYVDAVEVTMQKADQSWTSSFKVGDIAANLLMCFIGGADSAKAISSLAGNIINGVQLLAGGSSSTDTKKIVTEEIKKAGAVTVIDTTLLNSTNTNKFLPYVSSQNSLIGASATESVGSQVKKLSNGNLLVADPLWGRTSSGDAQGNAKRGALAFINRDNPAVGLVSETNSFVGNRHPEYNNSYFSIPGEDDQNVISDISQVYEVGNSNYLLANPAFALYIMRVGSNSINKWRGFTTKPAMGIVSWGDGNKGLTGQVGDDFNFWTTEGWVNDVANYSIGTSNYVTGYIDTGVGATVQCTDLAAGLNVVVNNDGSFVVSNPNYNNNEGVRIWGDGNHLLSGRLFPDIGAFLSISSDKVLTLDDGYNHYGPISGANASDSPPHVKTIYATNTTMKNNGITSSSKLQQITPKLQVDTALINNEQPALAEEDIVQE